LAGNKIKKIEGLYNLSVYHLVLNENKIHIIENLPESLNELYIEDNTIENTDYHKDGLKIWF